MSATILVDHHVRAVCAEEVICKKHITDGIDEIARPFVANILLNVRRAIFPLAVR